jgi:polyisoprenoid-binding protein YceI
MIPRRFIIGLIVALSMAVLLISGIRTGAIAGRGIFFRSPVSTYRIDASQSRFMAHASRGGLAWFKGHSHNLAVRDFSGTVELTVDSIDPASLQMSVRADSLEETDPVFTPEQKTIIKKELDELVLESAKYPEITFRSTDVKGTLVGGKFDIRIRGDLTLHGVTRQITIPAMVTVEGDTLRAVGEFEIDRKDFNVNATTAFYGLVRVKHDVKFEFDIVAKRI